MSSSRACGVIQLPCRQPLQRLQRLPGAQFGMPAAGNQLLRLREELDLADAAPALLDVVALDRDLGMPLVGVHLPLHVVHVGERGKVEIPPPDERRDLAEQRLPGLAVAGARVRLDHRRAFPGAPFALVVAERRRGRDRDRRRGRIGTQPQIDAEDVAVAGALLQQPRHALARCARRTAAARCPPSANWLRRRRRRSGRRRSNSSARPRPSCPSPARSGRSLPPARRGRAARCGRAPPPAPADSEPSIAWPSPRHRSARR